MTLVAGCDPGFSGAFCLLDTETRHLQMWDMPVVKKTVGKAVRSRMDMTGLEEMIARLAGVPLVTLEDPGARSRQAGQMAFGIGLGAIQYALHQARLRVEMIVPTKWKKALRVPADKKEAVLRAEEMFPLQRELFRGPRGGVMDGRAEAALIALYGSQTFL